MDIISFVHLGKWGQCGNQLFEIAGVIGLCHRYGAKPAFPPDWKYRKDFNIPEEYYKDVVPDYFISGHQKCYNPDLLEGTKKNKVVNITEYLQSEKYFFKIRDKIKVYLTPQGTKDLGVNSVAIHVRRGDYVGHPYFQQLQPEYYLHAIRKYFKDKNYVFYICSDDPGYCKEVFPGDNFIIESRTEIEDLRILAGCRYHILSNSTFSWWGAYLSESSIVIRPPKIFAGLYSKIRDETDYWPKYWIINDGLFTGFSNSFNSGNENNGVTENKTLCALRKITDNIVLKASFVSKPGLLNGKMGICIYLYHFYRITGNKVYEDYAGELLEDIFSSLSNKTPGDFESGLAGIGWGIEYLAGNGFVDADTDEVLSEFDQILSEKICHASHLKFTFLSGITGIGFYFLSRVVKFDKNGTTKFTLRNEHFIIQMVEEIEKRTTNFKKAARYYNGGISIFSLSWDYPVLLCLLAEIFRLNVLQEKVGNIILSLLSPLEKEENLPKLNINMVFMIMVMEKLEESANSCFKNANSVSGTVASVRTGNNIVALCEIIKDNIIDKLEQDVFENEMVALIDQSLGFQSGVIWLCRNMLQLKEPKCENEQVLWKKFLQKNTDRVSSPVWFEKQKNEITENTSLLDGFPGAGLQLLYGLFRLD
jgi:hypothetical protein